MGKIRIIVASVFLNTALLSPTLAQSDSARFHLNAPDDFIAAKAAVFKVARQDIDPFGKPQDPNKKVIIAEKPKQVIAPTPEIKILIDQEITKLAKRTNVFRKAMIVDGGTTYRRGDEIEVEVKGEVFPLKIIAITNNQIKFYNLKGKNLITLDMDNKAVLTPADSNKPSLGENDPSRIKLD